MRGHAAFNLIFGSLAAKLAQNLSVGKHLNREQFLLLLSQVVDEQLKPHWMSALVLGNVITSKTGKVPEALATAFHSGDAIVDFLMLRTRYFVQLCVNLLNNPLVSQDIQDGLCKTASYNAKSLQVINAMFLIDSALAGTDTWCKGWLGMMSETKIAMDLGVSADFTSLRQQLLGETGTHDADAEPHQAAGEDAEEGSTATCSSG